jgi:hypothetical protein
MQELEVSRELYRDTYIHASIWCLEGATCLHPYDGSRTIQFQVLFAVSTLLNEGEIIRVKAGKYLHC